jgi:exodeoxyribonuclease V alpha subunit
MGVHLSARLAWHMDGWDGHVCTKPEANTYCVGNYSFPGDQIRETRDLKWERARAGKPCAGLDGVPPCVYSINAFGKDTVTGYSDPPDWYPAEQRRTWDMPASTISIWPFEQMYRDEVKRHGPGQTYDYDKRLAYAEDYLAGIEENSSLVFYYANYSNPFSEEDARRYVVIGMSRVKKLGKPRFYEGMTDEARQKYGGGFVWAVDLTSHYPDQGFRLPYHKYLDDREKAEMFLVVPSNPRNFKYATRQFADDDALELVERLIEAVGTLREMGDTTENWTARLDWLHSVVGELWQERGLFPGMPAVLDHLGFAPAISFFKEATERGHEREAAEGLIRLLDGELDTLSGLSVSAAQLQSVQRRWLLLEDDERGLIRTALIRFDVSKDQIAKIIGPNREAHGIRSSLTEVTANPYALSEQFVGDDSDDRISFTRIDHGMLPSPELGAEPLAEPDDWRRLRALCVDWLKAQQSDVFTAAGQLIHEVNRRLSFYPDWKRHQFTERYLEVDREKLEPALELRREQDALWIYLRDAYDDERRVEADLAALARRKAITLRTPFTDARWIEALREPDSPLFSRAGDEYARAIEAQARVCAEIFLRPLCIVAGEAGTGKTTVVRALIEAVEATDGAGASFQLLAPTGKAAERLRERTGRREETATIHSFLAKRGWLNDNLTFKRRGGRREDEMTTYVIDEASMLSLELMAALARAIDWTSVKRLILVGDPSQLPPIGRGRVFADVIDWLQQLGGVGRLEINVRQMENRVLDRGTGILELADAFVRRDAGADELDAEHQAAAESILRRVQEGGDVDQDLRVRYWRGGEDLKQQMLDTIVEDIALKNGAPLDPARRWEFWQAAFDDNTAPDAYQVITPYRGDESGTESLNQSLQEAVHGKKPAELNTLEGVALGDKVIQVKNRPPSNPIWAWCWSKRTSESVEVYNGELGFVKPHAFDSKSLGWKDFRPRRFNVRFSTKPDHGVGYGSGLGKTPDGKKWLPAESVEENLELAYAISIHKAQGSEFTEVYFVVPKHKRSLLSRELFYTGLTRATRRCTLFVEEDISPLLSMRRLEQSRLLRINASLFSFQPIPEDLRTLGGWYEEGKIYSTLTEYMVRSKSEVIIANMLFDREISFRYEVPLYAPDGTFYLPDFTVRWQGEDWYWEHVGRLDDEDYRNRWETKRTWYETHFPGRLVTTEESPEISTAAAEIIADHFS